MRTTQPSEAVVNGHYDAWSSSKERGDRVVCIVETVAGVGLVAAAVHLAEGIRHPSSRLSMSDVPRSSASTSSVIRS